MKKFALAASLCLPLIFTGNNATAAETMAQKEAAAISNPRVIAVADVMNSTCGSKAEVMVEWSTFPVEIVGAKNPALWCNQALETLIFLCQRDPAFKQSFAKNVKIFSCKQGNDPTKPFSLTPEGRLTYAIDWNVVNIPDGLFVFLSNPQ